MNNITKTIKNLYPKGGYVGGKLRLIVGQFGFNIQLITLETESLSNGKLERGKEARKPDTKSVTYNRFLKQGEIVSIIEIKDGVIITDTLMSPKIYMKIELESMTDFSHFTSLIVYP